jgi:replicative DNA helicase
MTDYPYEDTLEPAQLAPHGQTLEEQLLGRLLVNHYAIPDVANILNPKDFFILRHEWIFEAMMTLQQRGIEPEYILVIDELRAKGRLDDIGGAAYITYLSAYAQYTQDVTDLAHRIKDYAYRRQMLTVASDIAAIAREEDMPIETSVQEAENRLGAITTQLRKQSQDGLRPMADFIDGNMDDMLAAYEAYKSGKQLGLGTGLTDLDNIIRLKPATLITIAARPRVGKSAFMQTVIYNHLLAPFVTPAANGDCTRLHGGRYIRLPEYGELDMLPKLALFSAEMSAGQNINRFAAMITGVSAHAQETGKMTFEEFSDVQHAKQLIEALQERLLIKTGRITPRFILEESRIWQPAGIFADYLQKLKPDRERKSKREEVSDISGALKDVAFELDIPVITGAQINREGASKPTLENLKESGSIEEDSDIVLLLHREVLNNEFTENPNDAEVFIGKHRNGGTGKVITYYRAEETRFLDRTAQHYNIEELQRKAAAKRGVE